MPEFILKNKIYLLFGGILLSLVMHINTFNKELMSIHVWRQTQTQSTIINFHEEDFNILNPKRNNRGNGDGTFRMEFPLMQWLIACLYKLFGNHLMITRICTFIIGLFSVIGLYKLLQNLFNDGLPAIFGAFAFIFSPCIYYYMVNPLPDNFALCLGIWSLAVFFSWVNNKKYHQLIFSALLLALATLCKLPFVIYACVPFSYFFIQLSKKEISFKTYLFYNIPPLIWFLMPAIWYISVIPTWGGNGVVKGVMDNTISIGDTISFLLGNLISTLPELLLNYSAVPLFICGAFFLFYGKKFSHSFFIPLLSMGLATLAYFLFEINMISTDHDYYLFPFYPLLFMLVAYGAWKLFLLKPIFLKLFVITCLLATPVTCYLRMGHRWEEVTPGINPDLLKYKTELRNSVPKDALCIAGNDRSGFIFFYYIDKKGWNFNEDVLPAQQMQQYIQRGAMYLYSDSRAVDENPEVKPFLHKLIAEKGSIRVYSLQP